MQPLPVLTDAQVKVLGPLQPAGSVPKVPETPNPDIVLPSLEVNVMLSVCVAPATTDRVPATEAVATTESWVPVGPLLPAIGLPGGLPAVLPATPLRVPLLLL